MNLRLPRCLRIATLLSLCATVAMLGTLVQAETLPLERAIRLALSHGTTTAISDAEVQRAIASFRELQNNRIPQIVVGSGIGPPSYGFPLTIEGAAPSIVTVATQSSIYNPAKQQFLGAAKADIRVTKLQDKDQRNAVIQDVAVSYAEFISWQTRATRLQQDETQAQQMVAAVEERVKQGVDSETDLNKAKLTEARVRLHQAQATGSIDVLRRHLANMTGLPVSAIEPDAESIPTLPPIPSEDESQTNAAASSPAIKIADQRSLAEALRASAEHRMWLPTFDFAAQYALLSNTISNYGTYYKNFQINNITAGVAVRFPFFNFSQRARAKAADFEALKAKKQAEATRNQVSEETLQLEHTAEQLQAARDVAQLEYQVAQSGLQAAQMRIQAQTGTYHELVDAQVQANERYLLYQDADFQYQRARMNLLRATGDLEKWALPGSRAKP
jgi:outer membrane protein TolC